MSRHSSWRGHYAVCPYFRKETPCTISCEGLMDNSTIKLIYQLRDDCSRQFDTFCANHCEWCEVYEAITKAKYADD